MPREKQRPHVDSRSEELALQRSNQWRILDERNRNSHHHIENIRACEANYRAVTCTAPWWIQCARSPDTAASPRWTCPGPTVTQPSRSARKSKANHRTPDVPLYADDSSSLVDQKNIDTVAHQAVEARLTTGNVRMDAT